MPDILLHAAQEPLVIEGAMGTMLTRFGLSTNHGSSRYNLEEPETIEQIHQLYVQAGAQVAVTNTFDANANMLKEQGLDHLVAEINQAAVRLAHQAKPQHILGNIGPCGLMMQPVGMARFDEVFAIYQEQAHALISERPDGILIETMIDLLDARAALLAVRSVSELPVLVTCSFDEHGRMPLSGSTPEVAAVVLEACGATAIGVNCSAGPDQALEIIKAMRPYTSLDLIAQPNAGLPTTNARGELVYSVGPDKFASRVSEFLASGVRFMGSCCGSTPATTVAIALAVQEATAAAQARRLHGVQDDRDTSDTHDARDAQSTKSLLASSREVFVPSQAVDFYEIETEPSDSLDEIIEAILDIALEIPDQPLAIRAHNLVALECMLKAYCGLALVDLNTLADSDHDKAREMAKRFGALVKECCSCGGGSREHGCTCSCHG